MRIRTTLMRSLAMAALAAAAFAAQATPSTSYYVYDEAGHVIGEYDASGNPVQEHIYLGDRPVAVVQNGNASAVDYVTTDQLNTPRAVTDSSQTVEWSWTSDPFGNDQPTGSLTYNLRFPGQYYDAETGHDYNYMRDYDPSVGRYIESDPLGVKRAGPNTYGYVGQNPLDAIDPHGLFAIYGNWCGPNWTGGNTKEWNQMTPNEQQNAAQPIGDLDAACEAHDKCYANCRAGFPCNKGNRGACMRNCDLALAGQASSIFMSLSGSLLSSQSTYAERQEAEFALTIATEMWAQAGLHAESAGKDAPNCPHCGVK